MKMLNVSISSFIILNLVSKGIFDFHVTTATDIYMYMEEVLRSCFRKALKALILTIIVLNLVSKGLFFTILSYYRTLNVVQDSAIQAICSSFHRQHQVSGGFIKNFAKLIGKHLCRSLFVIKLQASGLELYQNETIRQGTLQEIYEKIITIIFQSHVTKF